MPTVTSKDGTTIAFDQMGQGTPLILVDGALCHRSFGPMPGLAPLLAPHFSVYMYDRRGRGESGDTLPYSVEHEVEDIAALIKQAGGSAVVYGTSSGAALALEATIRGLSIKKLAMYEPPYNSDPGVRGAWAGYKQDIDKLLSEGRRGDTAACFMAYVGTPPEAVEGMRHAPVWPMFEAVAPTLAYDAAVLGDGAAPVSRAASVTVPTLVMAGGATFPFMHETAKALQQAIPHAQYRVLEGQTHDVAADVVAPALIEFFKS
jgi:pimeloyl-ACP methyl ester carboxylesterase